MLITSELTNQSARKALFTSVVYTTYGLWTKYEVKMAGYWPSSFFACLLTETASRSINSQKIRRRPISSHLVRKSLVNKGFIIWLSRKLFSRDTAGNPERTRQLHLASSSSQSQRVIWFILPAHGASHIINTNVAHIREYPAPKGWNGKNEI